MAPPALSVRWERLTEVRKRFRRKADWLKKPVVEVVEGEGDAEQFSGACPEPCTKFLKWNAGIIRAAYLSHKMQKPSISKLEKQAPSLSMFVLGLGLEHG